MRISDWSSDVCSSDLPDAALPLLDGKAGQVKPGLMIPAATCLADRPAVHQAAVAPLSVDATLELHGRTSNKIALDRCTQIAHLLDKVVSPFIVKAQAFDIVKAS